MSIRSSIPGKIIPVDRSQALDPSFFVDSLLPMPQDFTIEEQDDRSLALTEIDAFKINVLTVLGYGEISVVGDEALRILKEECEYEYIRPDAKVLVAFLDNQDAFLSHWKPQVEQSGLLFSGTILRNSDGTLYFPAICLRDGKYCPSVAALTSRYDKNFLFAALLP